MFVSTNNSVVGEVKGFDVERIKNRSLPKNIKEDDVCGTVYRVPILGAWTEGKRKKSTRSELAAVTPCTTESAQAALADAKSDEKASSSSSSSSSTSTSSSSAKKKRKSKKDKKGKKKSKKSKKKSKKKDKTSKSKKDKKGKKKNKSGKSSGGDGGSREDIRLAMCLLCSCITSSCQLRYIAASAFTTVVKLEATVGLTTADTCKQQEDLCLSWQARAVEPLSLYQGCGFRRPLPSTVHPTCPAARHLRL